MEASEKKEPGRVWAINKKYLLLRIIVFPLKLVFMWAWYLVFGVMISLKWVITGSQEILIDSGKLSELIEQNEKMIEQWKTPQQ